MRQPRGMISVRRSKLSLHQRLLRFVSGLAAIPPNSGRSRGQGLHVTLPTQTSDSAVLDSWQRRKFAGVARYAEARAGLRGQAEASQAVSIRRVDRLFSAAARRSGRSRTASTHRLAAPPPRCSSQAAARAGPAGRRRFSSAKMTRPSQDENDVGNAGVSGERRAPAVRRLGGPEVDVQPAELTSRGSGGQGRARSAGHGTSWSQMVARPLRAAPRNSSHGGRKCVVWREDCQVGRTGLEPVTLGLKVRLDDLQRAARNGKILQGVAFQYATSCHNLAPAETSPYAHGTRTPP